ISAEFSEWSMQAQTLSSPAIAFAPSSLTHSRRKSQSLRYAKKAIKRLLVPTIFVVIPLAFGIYWIPIAFVVYFLLGLIDVMRNTRRTLGTIDRYFFGNGFFTWILAPFNLLMDLLCLPHRNKGVYNLSDLPAGHQAEINELIEATQKRDLLAQLQSKM